MEARPTCGECGQHVPDQKPAPRAPTGLGPVGRAFWRDVVADFDPDVHERRLLLEACRTIDEMERVQQELDAAPSLVAKGSMGQAVEFPLLDTLRKHRLTLDKLYSRLGFSDSKGNVVTDGQKRSQQANDARWGPRRAQKARERATDLRSIDGGRSA